MTAGLAFVTLVKMAQRAHALSWADAWDSTARREPELHQRALRELLPAEQAVEQGEEPA